MALDKPPTTSVAPLQGSDKRISKGQGKYLHLSTLAEREWINCAMGYQLDLAACGELRKKLASKQDKQDEEA